MNSKIIVKFFQYRPVCIIRWVLIQNSSKFYFHFKIFDKFKKKLNVYIIFQKRPFVLIIMLNIHQYGEILSCFLYFKTISIILCLVIHKNFFFLYLYYKLITKIYYKRYSLINLFNFFINIYIKIVKKPMKAIS